MGEILTPMNTHIAWIDKGNKELILAEDEEKRNSQKGMNNEQDTKRLNAGVLQRHLQIHDDDLVSLFHEGRIEDLTHQGLHEISGLI